MLFQEFFCAVEGKPFVSKGSLLTQIKCKTNADCKDPKCICADFNLCFCGNEFATQQLRSNNEMEFQKLKGGDLKN